MVRDAVAVWQRTADHVGGGVLPSLLSSRADPFRSWATIKGGR